MDQWPGQVVNGEDEHIPYAVPENAAQQPEAWPGEVVGAQQQNVPDQYQGGFADELPPQAISKLSPQDEAEYRQLLHSADAATLQRFLAQHGKATDPKALADYIAIRDAGRQVGDSVTYTLPPAEDHGGAAALGGGAVDAATLGFGDELHGVASGIGALAHGESYQDAYARTVDEDRAQSVLDEQQHPTSRFIGQLIGGLAIPAGAEKAGLTATYEAVGLAAGKAALREGVTMQEARAIARRIGVEGATYGGAYGAGSNDGDLGQRVAGAGAGAAIGAATGLAATGIGRRLAQAFEARASARAASPQAEAGAAAARQGIDVLPADVGGPITRSATAITARTPGGVMPIIKAAERSNAQGANRVAQIASQEGVPAADVEGFGAAASEGAQKYVQLAKRAGGRLYDAAANRAGNVRIDLKQARDTIDAQIARLKESPVDAPDLPALEKLRANLDRPATVQGVRDMRTELFVSPDFRNTSVESRAKAVVNAASRDIEDGLRAQGLGDVADQYRAADDNWRQMLANIRRNIEPIVGKLDNLKSAEKVASALNSTSKNNGVRLGSFIASLPPEQSQIVRGSILAPLGRDASGNFSLSRFATDWGKISPIAKRQAFSAEAVSALNDLATVGNQSKAAKSYANHSNTGRAVMGEKLLSPIGAAATGAGTVLGGLAGTAAALAGQAGIGMLLASPRFARWLARAPKTQLSAPAYIDRLSRIASKEPAIANQVLQLQQRITEALGSSPARIAADEMPPERQPVDRQGNQQQEKEDVAQP